MKAQWAQARLEGCVLLAGVMRDSFELGGLLSVGSRVEVWGLGLRV